MRASSGKPTESTVAGAGTGAHTVPPSQPEPSSADAALRAISQPKRKLYHYLSSAFASGALKAGGRVILRSGPGKAEGVPSVSSLMRGKL